MSEEQPDQSLQVYQEQNLSLSNAPEAVLQEAHRAAVALKDVISKKSKPVMFNGEQYLEFEDWQTVGRFYGITAKVICSRPIEIGQVQGFEATAVAYHVSTGREISSADSLCMNDEKNWSSKPMFQLRSMAQTRACAKALRNVLAWVVVLAGYRATPAEEITSMERAAHAQPQRKSEAPAQDQAHEGCISTGQQKRLFAIAMQSGFTKETLKDFLMNYGIEHSNKILWKDYEGIIVDIQANADRNAKENG